MKIDLRIIFQKLIKKILKIKSPSECWLKKYQHRKDRYFLVELEMKEWIRSENKENGTNTTQCPYCKMVFKQTVNSKWCPACDQAVLLTKGMPYQNYIPVSPYDRDRLRYRKQILTYIRERPDIFEKDPNII